MKFPLDRVFDRRAHLLSFNADVSGCELSVDFGMSFAPIFRASGLVVAMDHRDATRKLPASNVGFMSHDDAKSLWLMASADLRCYRRARSLGELNVSVRYPLASRRVRLFGDLRFVGLRRPS